MTSSTDSNTFNDHASLLSDDDLLDVANQLFAENRYEVAVLEELRKRKLLCAFEMSEEWNEMPFIPECKIKYSEKLGCLVGLDLSPGAINYMSADELQKLVNSRKRK